ncbi:XRE family transcriptional regulator [Leucobacter luti]|uniref:Putative transcriptional regulator n=1 Tax=Leucobacter luti TaxID=340320 RepID=A0A4Q7TKS4_9MICO|nr:XRE family transcriptional regulator [Leucobacter luti]MBL3700084.1 helix-turn-helix domain-containing protein [Leucobacter luti]RZT61196.1 putative transcriptional regulator [Leucobacter luti]
MTLLTSAPAPGGDADHDGDDAGDALTLGRRVREQRALRGMTLEQLAAAVDRAPSQLSAIENGKREPRLPLLRALAAALGVTVDELLLDEAPSERAALEIAVERAQRGTVFGSLGIQPIRVSKATSDDTLKAILGLHQEVERLHRERAATPEEARRANTELRAEMRVAGNYYPDLERAAQQLLDSVGYTGGPVSQRHTAGVAEKLGFSLHYVSDMPHSTRSVIDRRNGRIYLSSNLPSRDARAPILRALASLVCGHEEPRNYADFLRQRVEANYLAGAVLLPEAAAVDLLVESKKQRQISMEDLRDAFGVSYEMAAHRFTNLATERLGLQVHFMKAHESGTLIKAYENDGVRFPSDALGNFEGAMVCRNWTARTVFGQSDRFNPWYQYTDMSAGGTYWCTSRVEKAKEGLYSVSVGVRFDDVKWFRGRETPHRSRSFCPDDRCCRQASSELTTKWAAAAWPEAATPTSLLAALPTGTFPGVDANEVYAFLEQNERRA